jgi:hypothetical protein
MGLTPLDDRLDEAAVGLDFGACDRYIVAVGNADANTVGVEGGLALAGRQQALTLGEARQLAPLHRHIARQGGHDAALAIRVVERLAEIVLERRVGLD